MNDFRELNIYSNGKLNKDKSSNQDKGFKEEFEQFKLSIKSAKPAIDFESIYNTTKVTFKILESIRIGSVVELYLYQNK